METLKSDAVEHIEENQFTPAFEQCEENKAVAVRPAKTTFVREVTAVYRGARRAVDKMHTPEGAADFIRKILPDNSREHFIALYLDGGHKVIAFSVVSTGTANSCQIHPREVFQMALLTGAVAIVVGHNHPSGQLEPSSEDRTITKRLMEAAKVLGMKILDHVIVTDEGFYSFAQSTGL